MNAPTVLEAHRRVKRLQEELNASFKIKALAEAATHLAAIRLEADLKGQPLHPLSQKLLWAEWHFTKALADHHGEDIDNAFQTACENLNVDEDGEPVTDPDDYDEFTRSHRQSVWGMGA